ncbi:MAG: hypothetical protein ACXWLM_08075, partial [Myxococcales bacterium]
MADQKVTLSPHPPDPVVSRPLKTGANFVLVLPKKRFVYRHWDKEKYLPEEEGELILEGEGIGSDEKYEFVIEKSDSADGPWSEVTTVKAKVDGDKATAKYKFPKIEPKGHLTKVEWKRTKAKPGEQLGMHVEAENYEGGWLSIHVERRGDNGEWDVYARWDGNIEQGKFDTVFLVPKGKDKPEQWKNGKVVELSFDGEPKENDTLWMVAKTEGFDGSSLQFVLERTDENGNWAELGTAVSTVKDGEAKNSLQVPPFVKIAKPGEAGPEGHVAIKFGKNVFHKNEELVVWVDPKWLEGKGFEVTMERKVVAEGENWEEVAVVEAEPSEAKAEGGQDASDTDSGSHATDSGSSSSSSSSASASSDPGKTDPGSSQPASTGSSSSAASDPGKTPAGTTSTTPASTTPAGTASQPTSGNPPATTTSSSSPASTSTSGGKPTGAQPTTSPSGTPGQGTAPAAGGNATGPTQTGTSGPAAQPGKTGGNAPASTPATSGPKSSGGGGAGTVAVGVAG